jgi:hypothetical protein
VVAVVVVVVIVYLSIYLSGCLPVCLSVWCRFLNVFAMVSLVVISGGMEWPHVFGCFWQDCLDTHCRPPQEFSGLNTLQFQTLSTAQELYHCHFDHCHRPKKSIGNKNAAPR